ncbi:MAG: DUF3800 domain-containing protein, partial [Candidatus Acidiferrales bacterium]
VADSKAICGISVGLNLRDFRKISARPTAVTKFGTDKVTFAYKLLIRDCVELIEKDVPECANLDIAFTFDDRGDWKQAEEAYRELKTSMPAIGRRMGAVTHADDKKHPALQMADLLAHETRYALQEGTIDHNSRPVLQILKDRHTLYSVTVVQERQLSEWLS